MTREEIQAEYTKVAQEFGDLSFVRESYLANLKMVDEKMEALRKRRAELGTAFQNAPEAGGNAPTTAADEGSHAVAAPAGE